MKRIKSKIFPLLLCAFLSASVFAQVPQKFNYQGVARNEQGTPMKNQSLKLKISVLPTEDATVSEYEEIQSVTTNEFGLYSLQIGGGQVLLGDMKTVKWETGNKYIRVAIDPKGGDNFQLIGTTQLLSVPYAIYADKAGLARETVNGSTGGTRSGTVSTSATGTGTVNYLTKFTAANTIYNSQLFDNGTNVGLGTTSPASRLHISSPSGNVEHLRMENLSSTGVGKFIFYNDVAANYHTFTKYGSAVAGNYGGMAGFPYANLLAMGSNNSAAVFTTGNNLGFSLNYGATAKFKFFAHYPTGRVGIGGNSTPAATIHFNNTDGTSDTMKITNNTSGHTTTDGLDIREAGNAAQIINLENSTLSLGTNGTVGVTFNSSNQIGIGTTSPISKLNVADPSSKSPQQGSTTLFSSGSGYGSALRAESNSSGDASGSPIYSQAFIGGGDATPDNPSFENVGVWGHVTGEGSGGWGGMFSGGGTLTSPLKYVALGGDAFRSAIKIVDGSQGVGKVLASDADGNGTWQSLVPPKIRLTGNLLGTTICSTGVTTVLKNWTSLTETGGANYNATTGEYTITVSGTYSVYCHLINLTTITTAVAGTETKLQLVVNGVILGQGYLTGVNGVGDYGSEPIITMDVDLVAGDKVKFQFANNSPQNFTFGNGSMGFDKMGIRLVSY